MADHIEKNFEHEFSEMLKNFDEEIEIPDIPDVQSIFDRAEKETKVFSFKKYSKYIASAAAVVLICISIPIVAGAFGRIGVDGAMEKAADEPREAAVGFFADMAEAEEVVNDADLQYSVNSDSINEENAVNNSAEKVPEEKTVKEALEKFFAGKETASSAVSSSEMNAETGGSGFEDQKTAGTFSIAEDINSKRSIDISVEENSVSVILNDNSADEIITAFWVEGEYESSYVDGDYYVINLSDTVSEDDFENGYYLPMIGDAVYGTYSVSEEKISVAEVITRGIILLTVEINIGTGEYVIKANLV